MPSESTKNNDKLKIKLYKNIEEKIIDTDRIFLKNDDD